MPLQRGKAKVGARPTGKKSLYVGGGGGFAYEGLFHHAGVFTS